MAQLFDGASRKARSRLSEPLSFALQEDWLVAILVGSGAVSSDIGGLVSDTSAQFMATRSHGGIGVARQLLGLPSREKGFSFQDTIEWRLATSHRGKVNERLSTSLLGRLCFSNKKGPDSSVLFPCHKPNLCALVEGKLPPLGESYPDGMSTRPRDSSRLAFSRSRP